MRTAGTRLYYNEPWETVDRLVKGSTDCEHLPLEAIRAPLDGGDSGSAVTYAGPDDPS
jgi:hypothetical protein